MAVNTNDQYSYTSPAIVEETIDRRKNPPVQNTANNTEQQQQQQGITGSVGTGDKHLVRSAGTGGAVLGFLFGGPILSALLGFSSAYAVRKQNGWGDAARSLGELTVSAREKTAELEERTGIGARTTASINKICDDEREESLAFKTRAFLVSAWLAASECARENQLLEKGVEETGRGLEFLGRSIEKLKNKKKEDTATNTATPESKNGRNEEDLVFVSDDEVLDASGAGFRYTELVNVTKY